MLSDAPALDLLTGELVDALTTALPGMSVRDAEGQVTTSLGVVLYYELGNIVTTINGGAIPPGHVGVEYTLTLTAPELDPVQGRVTVIENLVTLLSVLDRIDSLYWDRAEKIRLTSGETSYRLEVVNLSSYTTPTPTPAPAPDLLPEEA